MQTNEILYEQFFYQFREDFLNIVLKKLIKTIEINEFVIQILPNFIILKNKMNICSEIAFEKSYNNQINHPKKKYFKDIYIQLFNFFSYSFNIQSIKWIS